MADFINEAENVALIGLKRMREYLNYEGGNKEYLHKAKVGAAAVTAYTRHFASLTNRQMVELAMRKTGDRKRLS